MKIRLYIRVRLQNGTRKYADPVFAANGKLKPFYALINHQPEHRPEGVYHIRLRKNGKQVWECVVTDPQQAVAFCLKRER